MLYTIPALNPVLAGRVFFIGKGIVHTKSQANTDKGTNALWAFILSKMSQVLLYLSCISAFICIENLNRKCFCQWEMLFINTENIFLIDPNFISLDKVENCINIFFFSLEWTTYRIVWNIDIDSLHLLVYGFVWTSSSKTTSNENKTMKWNFPLAKIIYVQDKHKNIK